MELGKGYLITLVELKGVEVLANCDTSFFVAVIISTTELLKTLNRNGFMDS